MPVGRRSLLVSGPAHSGKTTALVTFGRHYELRTFNRWLDDREEDRVPTLYVSLRPAATARTVLSDLARFLGLPTRSRPTLADLSDQVCDSLLRLGTDAVLIDDIHRLQPSTRGVQRAVDVLRYLAQQLPCVFVYATADEKHPFLTADGLGRPPLLRAAPLPYGHDWEQAIDALERMLRLHRHTPGLLAAQSRVLHRRTRGRVEALAHLVRSAAIQAVLDGSERITQQTLDAIG
nr:AAA family ATPase [Streptomyces sp. CT34]